MKKTLMIFVVAMLPCGLASARSVTFGSGVNEFTLDFTDTISNASNPDSDYGIVSYDYQMGTKEITQSQFAAFRTSDSLGANTPSFTGANKPSNMVTWFEGAQFVNWLNTSKGYHAAYDISSDDINGATFNAWDASVAANGGTNLYRHKDAIFFLPSEDEWVKAAYWNGTNIQTYATKPGDVLYQGNGSNGGWNYYSSEMPDEPWDVGSGSEELNGTYDMMGNVWEWMESPYSDMLYGDTSNRCMRSGSFITNDFHLRWFYREKLYPGTCSSGTGFRVATVPEPCSMVFLSLGGLAMARRRKA